ncbi:MAG: hypothetical protein C4527_08385 [Candidatus Omnitrophota bacterium]|jgi:hypothetical protein|nr:MAG: hypothetical protein C4527_08385 [Candidatus Omnitrophota bacterium]
MTGKTFSLFFVFFFILNPVIFAQPAVDLAQSLENRNNQYADTLEQYFRDLLVDQYPQRSEKLWRRSYESIDDFLQSVESNRQAWRRILNPPDFQKTGDLQRTPYAPLHDIEAEWLTLPLGPMNAEAILAIPHDATSPVPLVIAQHGIGSTPERVFGLLDDGDAYHQYGRELLKAGYAVLAPFNLRSVEKRNRIERLARLADTTLPGIEFTRIHRLLTEVLKDERIDAEKVGMWGLSLGGMATMFWTPLEPRIKVAIVAAWFNHRTNKMVIPDERYSCFLETTEEHAFFRGWLTYFSDYDVVSLICPRPLLIQAGKQDRIAWWPQIIEEFTLSMAHYERLGILERIDLDLHEGGHEVMVESGVEFLDRWLKELNSQ